MTKNDIRSSVEQLFDCAKVSSQIASFIAKGNRQVQQILKGVQDGSRKDIDNVCKEIFDIFEAEYGLEDGEVIPKVQLSLSSPILDYAVMKVPIGKHNLICSLGIADFGTRQIDISYENDDKSLQDVCLIEVKKGELAELEGLPEDNEAVDIYMAENDDMLRVARMDF